MAKWKKTEEQKKSFVQYMRFEEGKPTKITVSDWTFAKGMSYLFRCYVIAEDGEETDKIWTVWDFESTQVLKKKLGVNYVMGSKEITVTMLKNDEDETFYEIK